ncbi:Capsule synthesis positive regulator AcpB [Paenibacillus sp. P1XP2]|nr:Capsule synthesis positive regulator AcpB [Paenibacillus sp. P1XP2]
MNKEYRQLKSLLKLLDREERWFTFAEVESELGISDKSVRKIVESAVPLLPPSMQIEVSRGKGIMFRRDRHGTSIQEVLEPLLRETPYFRLMQRLFMHDGKTSAEEVAEELYMSFSSFKKWIVQLNRDELRPFQLRITYAAPTLKGNEIHVRYFLWKLFTEAYPYTGWPFSNADYARLDGWVTEIERENGMIYFLNAKRSLTFLIAIVLERVKQGHRVALKSGSYAWERHPFFVPVSKMSEKLAAAYGVVLPREEVYFLQSMFSLSQYHGKDGFPVFGGRALASEQEDDTGSRMSGLLISILENAFPALNASSRFLAEIREFMDKLRIDNAIPELMAVSHSHLTGYIRDKEQPIYAAVSECMRQWQRSFPELMYNDYHLTKLTFMVSASLRYKSKKAFLIIGEEFSVRHYVANLIKREIGDDLTIETSILHGLTDDIIREQQIDFVISTMPVSLTSVPTVLISTIPTKRDLENIRQELMS